MGTRLARVAGEGSQFLDRAEPDAIRLSQGAVDGPRFSDAHLGPVDQRGNIGGICVAVTNESFLARRLVDGCFKNPAVGGRIREAILNKGLYSETPPPFSNMQQ